MEATVQVRQRGTLTLPASLRERYKIKPGDTFHIVDLDGVLVLTPMAPMVPLEAGLSVEEMLSSLREQRTSYVREKYGPGRK
jgi:bifunctional DNA-binding transcriptional regulator/antitoxin component of YhaV-PrlF toxin-antitoxin module